MAASMVQGSPKARKGRAARGRPVVGNTDGCVMTMFGAAGLWIGFEAVLVGAAIHWLI